MLPDGRYDVIVVDAQGTEAGGVVVALTLLDGEHKGEVLDVRSDTGVAEPLDLLGIPATLTVTGGEPTVRFEP